MSRDRIYTLADLRAAEIRGMRRGFDLAYNFVDISRYAEVDWLIAEDRLVRAIAELENGDE